MSRTHTTADEGIAIIGMAGRFPGAANVDEFWDNLQHGVESISRFSDEELRAAGASEELLTNPRYVKAGGTLDGIDLFDAEFFGFTPREAEIMDPQHRVFLECAWEAIESAGYDPARYAGLIGVYAGMGVNAYVHNVRSNTDLARAMGRFHIVIANDKDFLTTRVSYKLNLRGPSVVVQSACSTSLVAVHLACQALHASECDMALAGGVSIGLPPKAGYLYQEEGILSSDGHCRAFAAGSDGFVAGSGVGIVVLKRLHDALADRDHILAVIRGSAVNNDGSLKVGYTAPSVDGQCHAIRAAHAAAGISADAIGYVEAHGTGTALGDPVEIAALSQVFRETTSATGFCAVGSVKTNVGHLDAAAGVASLIKAVLCLRHKKLVPSLHCDRPNAHIDFAQTPFYVSTALQEWTSGATPRRAGVNSLGLGGTNAHVVLEEAPGVAAAADTRPYHVLVLSARSSAALAAATQDLAHHLGTHGDLALADVAYTRQTGRRAFSYRRMAVCERIADAVAALEDADRRSPAARYRGTTPSVAFMFPGGGAHHANMAGELYRTERSFRAHVDGCLELLTAQLNFDLRGLLYPPADREADASRELQRTSVALPALFITEYALARLWMEWGVRPVAMIGHSLGEYVAACLSGVMRLSEALTLVVRRGQLLDRIAPGAMVSVPIAEHEVEPLLGRDLSVAAVNAPSLCVVSGPLAAIAELERELSARGIDCHRVHLAVGAHSSLVEPILDSFRQLVEQLSLRPPAIPFVSNVTGTWITTQQATSSDYWTKHLRQSVRFADGVDTLLRHPAQVLLEVGPGRTLTTLAQAHPGHGDAVILSSLGHPCDSDADTRQLSNALGRLWLAGAEIDWPAYHGAARPRRIPLPTYPFERTRFWVDDAPAMPRVRGLRRPQPHASDVSTWLYQPSWRRDVTPAAEPSKPFPRGRRCVLFSDGGAFTAKLADRLERHGYEAVTVVAGERYRTLAPRVYSISPRRPDDYIGLLSDLRGSFGTPQLVLHCWSIGDRQSFRSQREWFDECQYRGYYSLLFLAQAIDQTETREDLDVVVVSTHLHDVSGDGTAFPERATLLGPCKTIPQEHFTIRCRSVDVSLPDADSWLEERLLDQLLTEVRGRSEAVVAYRGIHRLVQCFEPIRLRSAASQPVLRERGVYLVTGGLGRLGLIVAEHLARKAKARLVLAGRSMFPPPEEWDAWLQTRSAQDPIGRTIVKLRTLEALGADVVVVTADVGDQAQMRAAVEVANDTFGDLNGVLHAAGVTKRPSVPRAIVEMGIADSEDQFKPKVDGVYAIEHALAGRDVDFCVLFSSVAAVLGGLGLSAYAAANLFMDAFASNRTSRGGRWLSLGWELWSPEDGSEKGLGSAAQYAIGVEEGVRVFDLALSLATAGHVVVSSGDLDARLETWVDRQLQPQSDDGRQAAAHPRPSLSSIYRAPHGDVEEAIAGIWQGLLGIDRIGAEDNFFELGGHSLLATRVVARVREAFGVQVPLRRVFEHPTIAGLAASVESGRARPEPVETSISRIDRDAGIALDQLDRLSDADVDDLLTRLLADREAVP